MKINCFMLICASMLFMGNIEASFADDFDNLQFPKAVYSSSGMNRSIICRDVERLSNSLMNNRQKGSQTLKQTVNGIRKFSESKEEMDFSEKIAKIAYSRPVKKSADEKIAEVFRFGEIVKARCLAAHGRVGDRPGADLERERHLLGF